MQKGQKIYVKDDGTRLRSSPDTSSATNIIRTLPKGQEVVCVEEGLWIRVQAGTEAGWVRSDLVSEIVPTSTPSIPNTIQQQIPFVLGEQNLFDSPNTIALRKIIGDEFGCGVGKDHLNCTEYVQYRVKTKLGITIKWPIDRPRNGGKWATIFKKNSLFKVLTDPVQNCAMCFTDNISPTGDLKVNDTGHVAFVEDVLPDGSVKISEANWPRNGMYGERTIFKAKWRDQYKAQFVKFD